MTTSTTRIDDPAFPVLHGRPERGWVNDPNGLAHVDGTYHVFFQYNPDAPVHENVHWGHVSSTDLVHWRQEPIALAPRPGQVDEIGCWTGCLVPGEQLTVLYTAAGPAGVDQAAVVCAVSDRSALEWKAESEAVPGSAGPEDLEVRDPYVFTIGESRYVIQGAGSADGRAQVLVWGCDDLSDWVPMGQLLTGQDPVAAALVDGDIYECPNLFPIGDRWVLIYSPLVRGDDNAFREPVYLIGDVELVEGRPRFRSETGGRLDAGWCFYAPQVLVDDDRRLMWGWAREVARTPEEVREAGWSGALTFPRELTLVDGRLRQAPAAELVALRQRRVEPGAGGELPGLQLEIEGRTGDLRLLLETGESAAEIYAHTGDERSVRILIDGGLVEVFADGVPQTIRVVPGSGSRWLIEGGSGLDYWVLGLS